jgi:hypothetical protein
VQAENGENIDKEKQPAEQLDTIKKVINWLREEGLEPQEITHLRKDARYYGVVISNEAEIAGQIAKHRRKAFHILFPVERPDSLTISEIIIFDLKAQKAYSSLGAKTNGFLEQNRFYSELMLALLQLNVDFLIKKNVRELRSLEIFKVIFFDGLTKDVFFNTINKVHNSIEIAKIKTGLLRDSVFSSDGSPENEKDSWK